MVAATLANEDGVSLNQFMAAAVAEKAGVMATLASSWRGAQVLAQGSARAAGQIGTTIVVVVVNGWAVETGVAWQNRDQDAFINRQIAALQRRPSTRPLRFRASA